MSSPLRPTMRSIAIGVQATPLLAMPANATAMLIGATSLVPITEEGTLQPEGRRRAMHAESARRSA
jgi:hypothetical protein